MVDALFEVDERPLRRAPLLGGELGGERGCGDDGAGGVEVGERDDLVREQTKPHHGHLDGPAVGGGGADCILHLVGQDDDVEAVPDVDVEGLRSGVAHEHLIHPGRIGGSPVEQEWFLHAREGVVLVRSEPDEKLIVNGGSRPRSNVDDRPGDESLHPVELREGGVEGLGVRAGLLEGWADQKLGGVVGLAHPRVRRRRASRHQPPWPGPHRRPPRAAGRAQRRPATSAAARPVPGTTLPPSDSSSPSRPVPPTGTARLGGGCHHPERDQAFWPRPRWITAARRSAESPARVSSHARAAVASRCQPASTVVAVTSS